MVPWCASKSKGWIKVFGSCYFHHLNPLQVLEVPYRSKQEVPIGVQEVPENQVSVGWMGILGWGEVKDTLHCK